MDATIAFCLVLANFGIAMAARMPMMTTTINSSMRVKPSRRVLFSRATVRAPSIKANGVLFLLGATSMPPLSLTAISPYAVMSRSGLPAIPSGAGDHLLDSRKSMEPGQIGPLSQKRRRIAPPPLVLPVPRDLTSRPGAPSLVTAAFGWFASGPVKMPQFVGVLVTAGFVIVAFQPAAST